MTIIKCKMCGGDINLSGGQSFGCCDSCGSTMTLPKVSDERKANLFNRANHFRRLNDFDKALTAYENILNEDNTDAEVHWGVVLSKYGIEYVEDPISHNKVPTCHRMQMESVLTDPDYLSALEYSADGYTRSLYEEEASKISVIQKGILSISQKEEPYDVFICYKESTDGGSRTKDSTMAQDIYYHLIQEGYKVLFSRITLEDKLGKEYEPYIFAALNSSKVMVVVGTKSEYFNAVWVKNEWSRFLEIIKKDRNRLLIPCYKDMDAYDLPEELSTLQSQDMGKIGFIQDLVRGIKKVLDVNKVIQPTNSIETTASGNTQNAINVAPGVISLLKRGNLFLEDGDFKSADEYFNRVLDIDPENANAYIGKLMAELRIKHENDFASLLTPIENNGNYLKALRFADCEEKNKYVNLHKTIIENLANEIDEFYNKALKHIENDKYKDAIRIRSEACL